MLFKIKNKKYQKINTEKLEENNDKGIQTVGN